jgi:hypothetical protein
VCIGSSEGGGLHPSHHVTKHDEEPQCSDAVCPADPPCTLDRTTDPTYQARLQEAARQLGPVILAARQAASAPPGATTGDHPDVQ